MTRLEQIMVKMGFDVSESSKVTDAMNKVNHEAKKAGEGMEGFNLHGREGHELIHKIAQASPVMGAALKAALSPEAAGIAALIVAFEWLHKQIEKVEEKVKELTEEMREMWLSEQESAQKAQEVYESYERKISEILDTKKQKLEDETKVYERQLALIKEIQSGHEKEVAAINEAADADLKRKRDREDRATKRNEENEIARVGKNEPAKEAIRKRYELEKQALDDKREYEDATIKRQREKQADADAATAERATQVAMANRLKALEAEKQKALDDGKEMAEEQKKQLAAKYALEAQQGKNLEKLKKDLADADAEINRRSGGSVMHSLARTASYGLGDAGTILRAQDEAKLAEAQKKKADLEAEYKKMLQDRADIQKKIEASTKKITDNETDVAARVKSINELTQKQKDLNQQIAQNQTERRRIGNIRDQELAQLKSDLNPGGPLTQSEMLANALTADSTLQQAKAGLQTATTQAGRNYWQQIINSRTAFDRARFPGVLTPEELRAGAEKPGETDPNTEYLRRLADALAPPGEDS